uniref:Uncharacterized protein n=1 Tax=Lepeophtheirus salmonis TaxID=72036 RepID=A0A0K2TG13_LEPSM
MIGFMCSTQLSINTFNHGIHYISKVSSFRIHTSSKILIQDFLLYIKILKMPFGMPGGINGMKLLVLSMSGIT